MGKPSKVSATVDFAKNGKLVGHLAAPHSREESGWEHGRVISEEGVTTFQIFREIGERAMRDGARGPVYNQQSGMIATRRRSLSDEAGRQRVIEEVGSERRHDKARFARRGAGANTRI